MRVSNRLAVDKLSQKELNDLLFKILRKYNQPMFVIYGMNIEQDNSVDLDLKGITGGIIAHNRLEGVDIIKEVEVVTKKKVSMLTGREFL